MGVGVSDEGKVRSKTRMNVGPSSSSALHLKYTVV